MDKERQALLRKAALLIRFRTDKPTNKSFKYASYRQIAQVLKLTENEVQHICRKAACQTLKNPTLAKIIRQLNQEHIDFLLQPKTLELWSGLTMKQRTIMFHRQFTDKRIAVTSLRRLYLKHGVRRKKVRQEKHLPLHVRSGYQEKCRRKLEEITRVKNGGRKLVYLDEINFTKRSVTLKEWSAKNTNLTIDNEDIYIGYRSVIAAMTEEEGIIHVCILEQAVASEDFISYLKKLR